MPEEEAVTGEGVPSRAESSMTAPNDVNECMLSLKDMCMLKSLSRLIDAGIDSFKIEGRMKKPEYVAATVTAYREVRDAPLAGESVEKLAEEQEKKLLRHVYNRGGFYFRLLLHIQWQKDACEQQTEPHRN